MKRVTWDNKYELGGGMGSWAKSTESATINKGDVRLIGGILMYAYTIYPAKWYSASGDEVNWCPVDKSLNTFENLEKWLLNL